MEKSEDEELKNFDLKLIQSDDPTIEARRLSFWISTINKFADQLRSLSLYLDTSKNSNYFNHSSHRNSFFEQNHQNRQGGQNLKVRCLACPNFHVNKNGRSSNYSGYCTFFLDQNLAKQREILKTSKICRICLNPRNPCMENKDDPMSPCKNQLKFNIRCKSCDEKPHHIVMCPKSPANQFYQQGEAQTEKEEGGETEEEET